MPENFDAALAIIGKGVLALGGVSAFAYGMFRILGEKWLASRFEKKLSEYKHEQQKELESLKFRINSMMDRATKLHQREFDALPETWSLLIDAYNWALNLVSAFQEYPDLNRMQSNQMQEFIDKSDLMSWQKAELESEGDKTRYYAKAIFWKKRNDAEKALSAYREFLAKNGIFIRPQMREKFDGMATLILEALVERELNEEMGAFTERAAGQALAKKGGELVKSLEEDVRGRLWDAASIN